MKLNRASFFKSLNTQVLLVLLAMFITPLLAIGSQMVRNQKRILIRNVGGQLDLKSEKIADELDVYIMELLRDARAIALIPTIINMEEGEEQRMLDTLHTAAYPDYAKLAIIDLAGNVKIAAPQGELHNITAIDSFHTAAAGEQGFVIDKALTGDDLVVHMHTPIFGNAKNVIAVLGTPISFETLISALSGDFTGTGHIHAFIFDDTGRMLFSPTNTDLPENSNLPQFIAGMDDSLGYILHEFQGKKYIIGNTKIKSLGWHVIVEQPLSVVLQPALGARNSGLLIIFIISLFGLGMGFLIVNRLTSPLRVLANSALALADGHFDTPKPKAPKGSEVGILVEAFSDMRAAVMLRENALRESENALREERGQLALRVKERTLELEITNNELSKALKLKDEFVSTMSHELRTPLNIMLGLSEALLHGVYEPLPGQQKLVVENIMSSGGTLLSMVENVLSIAKVQAGKLELKWEPIDIIEICLSIIDEMELLCKKKNITLDYEMLMDTTVVVQADLSWLRKIIKELFSNAVKFTLDGGQVGLKIDTDLEAKKVLIVVWDTGIGIKPEQIKQTFKPFAQLDTGLTRTHGGAGLGLSLAKQLAVLHGGDIYVESTLNEGSRFTLTFPMRVAPITYQELTRKKQLARDVRPIILLAEDNELGLQTFTDYLEHYGYDVVPARNGLEVLAFVEEQTPDLILMDVQMPKMDGLDCMRRLRKQEKTMSVPIIALTGMAMHKDEQQCLAAGANEYLSKPISLRLLRKRIEIYLGDLEGSGDE